MSIDSIYVTVSRKAWQGNVSDTIPTPSVPRGQILATFIGTSNEGGGWWWETASVSRYRELSCPPNYRHSSHGDEISRIGRLDCPYTSWQESPCPLDVEISVSVVLGGVLGARGGETGEYRPSLAEMWEFPVGQTCTSPRLLPAVGRRQRRVRVVSCEVWGRSQLSVRSFYWGILSVI